MGKILNKSDVVEAIAASSAMSKAAATSAADAFMKCIINSVSQGDRVVLVGFGTFETSQRAARKARNPQTGAIIDIPAKKSPKFKAGKAFKDAVKELATAE